MMLNQKSKLQVTHTVQSHLYKVENKQKPSYLQMQMYVWKQIWGGCTADPGSVFPWEGEKSHQGEVPKVLTMSLI